MTRKTRAFMVVGAAAATLGSGVALATSGSGILSAPIIARGTLSPQFKLKLHDSSSAADAVVQQVVVGPGGFTGWHTHPGPAIVIVKTGEFTLYEADDPSCTGMRYTEGQIFVDRGYGNVHFGRNEGASNTELWVTYLDVPQGTPPRIDAASPGNCSF